MKKEITKGYWSNGNPRNEIPFINGKIHGLTKMWCPNGNISYQVTFKKNLSLGATIVFQY
jgi:antitoxin component YwqK of YwqJK toxin-antitoxin module